VANLKTTGVYDLLFPEICTQLSGFLSQEIQSSMGNLKITYCIVVIMKIRGYCQGKELMGQVAIVPQYKGEKSSLG